MPAAKRSRRSKKPAPGFLLGRTSPLPPPPPPAIPFGFTPHRPTATPRAPQNTDQLITYQGDGHLVTFAPTGAGKSSGPVICNALTHPGQLIVLDIKGEVHQATARRRREMGQAVHVLDMRDGMASDSLNPLNLATITGTDTAAIARTLASELVTRTEGERDRFWNDWAETLLSGGINWLLSDCAPEERQLHRLFDLFTGGDCDYKIACLLDSKGIAARAAVAAFGSYLNLPERETRPSVLASVVNPLRLFDSALVRGLTEGTTIDLAGFVEGRPMTLYIIVPPYRLTTYAPLLRLWISGLLSALTRRTRQPEHRTLLLCDEAGNLGRMEAFLTASTLMRASGLTLWSFWQNTAQLDLYGTQARTILDNAGVVQLFGARNRRAAQDFSAMVGGVDPDEILGMRPDQQLLLVEGGRPRFAQRLRYFEDRMFTGLYDSPASMPHRAR